MNARIPSPSPQPSRAKRRSARAEAAAWIVRLHGPHRAPELEAAFKHWLAAEPENARQFERVTEVWDTAGGFPAGGVARMGRLKQESFATVWLRAAVIFLVCGVAALGAYWLWFDSIYRTGVGEQRLVRLADGTRVSLNSGTRITVDYSGSERRVRLERGEAYFDVAADAKRSFTVVAGVRRITALGTSFVVRYEADRTAVTLVEGKVAVTPGAEVKDIILDPGERLVFNANQGVPAVDEPRIEAVTAWRRGEVLLDRTPLAEAVAEMNRYDEAKLVIEGPGIAQTRISGIYQTGDSEGFAYNVARLYGLEVIKHRGEIRLRPGTPLKP